MTQDWVSMSYEGGGVIETPSYNIEMGFYEIELKL